MNFSHSICISIIMAKRSTKSEFTVEQICDGFLYANLEPSELPEEAEDVIGKHLDRNEERYWALVRDFWTELKREARPADVQRLYQMTENAKELVEKGLRRQAAGKSYGDDSTESGASSDDESSEEAPKKPVQKTATKKDKAESPKKSTGSKKKTPATAPVTPAATPTAAPTANVDLAGGAKKKKAPAVTK